MRRNRRQHSQVTHSLTELTQTMVAQGTSYADMLAVLRERGVPQADAEQLIASTLSQQTAQGHAPDYRGIARSSALFDMALGGGLVVVAGLCSIYLFAATRGEIGLFTVAAGAAIVYGLVRFINGLFRLFER